MPGSIMKLSGWSALALLLALAGRAPAEIRVQDIARLQGQRTNKLMGYGLVVGLPGTGDGDKYLTTMRTLAKIHERYHQPILSDNDIKGNRSVALVTVEAVIPEHGAREGQSVDVVVSSVGAAKSLRGGQLLTTPLQYAMFDAGDPATQAILALGGGQVGIPDERTPTRGVIHNGAVLEADFVYSFIENGAVTLVLDEGHADWTWAHMVARAINHEIANPSSRLSGDAPGGTPAEADVAVATGPKTVVVRIPPYELPSPARFISAVEQTPLFDLPEQAARVIINRTTKNVSFTASVKISPTVLQLPGVGTVRIGPAPAAEGKTETKAAPGGEIGFEELFATLTAIKVTPDQLIDAIEHLHETGALHAQVQYK